MTAEKELSRRQMAEGAIEVAFLHLDRDRPEQARVLALLSIAHGILALEEALRENSKVIWSKEGP